MLLPLLSLVSLSLCASAVNVAVLQQSLAGHGVTAVFQSDPTYSNVSRAFNRRFTITPVAVAFPTSVAQVSAAVAAGTAQNLEVVARSGGHSYIANGLGGNNGALVVDMSKMKQITVRSSNNTALIETGNRLGDIALALSAAGRAMPHGTCSYVGIGGHSGYGGFGFTSRAWGLALDTVKSATVVLGNGSIVTASGSVNTDLYWAIRGASPSFGIATSIEVQTFPAPSSATVFEYKWNNVDIKTAATSISAFQTYVATPNLPQQFGAELVFSAGETKGTLQLGLTGGYYANISSAALDALLAPYLKNLPTPTSKMFIPGPYINSVSVFADPKPLNTSSGPDGFDTFYTKSLMTPESAPMSAKAVTAFATYMANQGFTTKTDWFVEVELYGGSNSAINQVPLDSTAFAKRDTLFTIQFYTSSNATMLPPFPDAGFTFLDGMVDSILSNEPADWNYGAYLNYIDDRLGANATKLYYGSHYPRLEAIKAKVDPKDTFRFPVGL
ncbi:glucooligosaccharide oxidase [Roridomyces roridus]|uniref:Glucooligosaccharide oxidase n=1 Tax=Roridomyces roridus TaxID=1738132 RepID=A0AAD7C1C6_9AGAR|nr:glucooligosaccharide oxidase [Roridomyces roridus]